MKNSLKIILAASLLSIGMQSALAAKATSRDVSEIIISNNGKVTVKLSGAAVNPANCSNSAYVIDATEDSKKEWIAQLLTAKAAGFKVTMSINDNVCGNGGSNPKVSNIIML